MFKQHRYFGMIFIILIVLLTMSILVAGCSKKTTPTPTLTVSPTAAATPTAAVTLTPEPTETVTPTPTPTPTPISTPSDTTPPGVSSVSPAGNASRVDVSTTVKALFSESMELFSINKSTFTLMNGSTPVPGNVGYDDTTKTAILNPDDNLEYSTTYTATLTTAVTDLAGNKLTGNYTWKFTTTAIANTDKTPPTIISVSPTNNASDVVISAPLKAVFSESMNTSTINTSNFTLMKDNTPVTGTVTYNDTNKTAIFTTSGSLASGSTYTATVTAAVMDLAGNNLAGNYTWSFTTASSGGDGGGGGTPADTTPPTIISVSPTNNASDVVISAPLKAVFSESMLASTINTSNFTLMKDSTPLTGTVTYNNTNRTATFTPAASFDYSTIYTATVTTAVMDLAGNNLAGNYTWSLTTASSGGNTDTTAPTIISVSPTNNASDVVISAPLKAVFSESMLASTINTSNFTLMKDSTPVTGTVSYNDITKTATFAPSSSLGYSTSYKAAVTTGVTDLTGNHLAGNYTWSFSTSPPPQYVTISIGAPATVSAGSPFDLNVNVSAVTNFSAFELELAYNNSVIQVTGGESGSGVTSGRIGSTTVPISNWVFVPREVPGKLRVVGYIPGLGSANGSGYLSQIHFNVTGAAGQICILSFSNVKLFDTFGNEITVSSQNGLITVTAP